MESLPWKAYVSNDLSYFLQYVYIVDIGLIGVDKCVGTCIKLIYLLWKWLVLKFCHKVWKKMLPWDTKE